MKKLQLAITASALFFITWANVSYALVDEVGAGITSVPDFRIQ